MMSCALTTSADCRLVDCPQCRGRGGDKQRAPSERAPPSASTPLAARLFKTRLSTTTSARPQQTQQQPTTTHNNDISHIPGPRAALFATLFQHTHTHDAATARKQRPLLSLSLSLNNKNENVDLLLSNRRGALSRRPDSSQDGRGGRTSLSVRSRRDEPEKEGADGRLCFLLFLREGLVLRDHDGDARDCARALSSTWRAPSRGRR